MTGPPKSAASQQQAAQWEISWALWKYSFSILSLVKNGPLINLGVCFDFLLLWAFSCALLVFWFLCECEKHFCVLGKVTDSHPYPLSRKVNQTYLFDLASIHQASWMVRKFLIEDLSSLRREGRGKNSRGWKISIAGQCGSSPQGVLKWCSHWRSV